MRNDDISEPSEILDVDDVAATPARSKRSHRHLRPALIVMGILACTALGFVFVVVMAHRQEQQINQAVAPLKSQVANYSFEDFDPEFDPGSDGYVRGKFVLVDFDRETRTGQLHSFHRPSLRGSGFNWGSLAADDSEVETIIWVEERYEDAGAYRTMHGHGRVTGIAENHIVTLTIIDRAAHQIIGRLELRDDAPATRNADGNDRGHVGKDTIFARLQSLPVAPELGVGDQ